MTFRTIDLQPLSLEQSSKFASLFNRNLQLRPRQGLYPSIETKVGVVFDVVCRNFLHYLGVPLSVRMEGRAATFCLINKVPIRDPRDIDVTFYFDASLRDNKSFEENIKKAIIVSLKSFFGEYDESLLLKDCLWNFTKVNFASNKPDSKGTMYLYSLGPEKHKCLDVKISLGEYRNWATLLDSFSIELLAYPLAAGSFEHPLKKAIHKIENRELDSLRPHEVTSGGFERYISASIEGFLDKTPDALICFLSSFKGREALFINIKKYLELNHKDKGDDYFINYLFQSALVFHFLNEPYETEELKAIIEKYESYNPHYAYLSSFLGKAPFEVIISPYLIIISLFNQHHLKKYLGHQVFSFSFGVEHLHFPAIAFEKALENYLRLDGSVKHHILFYSILQNLVNISFENKEHLIDQDKLENAILQMGNVDPCFAWLLYSRFSSRSINDDLLMRLPKIYELLEGKSKESVEFNARSLTLTAVRKLCKYPEGLKFICILLEKGIITDQKIYTLALSKWIDLFSKGEIKEDLSFMVHLFKTLLGCKELFDFQQSLYFEQDPLYHDASEIFILYFNIRSLLHLLDANVKDIDYAGHLILEDIRFKEIKNVHIKYLYQSGAILDFKTLFSPYLLLQQNALGDHQRWVAGKKVVLIPINNISKYKFIIPNIPFDKALANLHSYPYIPENSGLLQPILEKLRYNIEKNVLGFIDQGLLNQAFEGFSEVNNYQLELFGWRLLSLFKEVRPPKKWICNLPNLGKMLKQPSQRGAFFHRILNCLEPLVGSCIKDKFLSQQSEDEPLFSFHLKFLSCCLNQEVAPPDFSEYVQESIELFSLFFQTYPNKNLIFERFKLALPSLLSKKLSKPLLQTMMDASLLFNSDELQPSFNHYLSLFVDQKRMLNPLEVKDFLELFNKTNNLQTILNIFLLIKPCLEKDKLKDLVIKTTSILLESVHIKEKHQGALIFLEALKEYLFESRDFHNPLALQLIPNVFNNLTELNLKVAFSKHLLEFLKEDEDFKPNLNGFTKFLSLLKEEEIKPWISYLRKRDQIKLIDSIEEEFTGLHLEANRTMKAFNFLLQQLELPLSMQEVCCKKSLINKITYSLFKTSLQTYKISQISRVYFGLISQPYDFIESISYIENQGLACIEEFIEVNSYLFIENLPFLLTLYRKSQNQNKDFYLRHIKALKRNTKLHEFKEDIEELFGIDILSPVIISKKTSSLQSNNNEIFIPLNNWDPKAVTPHSLKTIAASISFACFVFIMIKASQYLKNNT